MMKFWNLAQKRERLPDRDEVSGGAITAPPDGAAERKQP